jgi:hypothetical protein
MEPPYRKFVENETSCRISSRMARPDRACRTPGLSGTGRTSEAVTARCHSLNAMKIPCKTTIGKVPRFGFVPNKRIIFRITKKITSSQENILYSKSIEYFSFRPYHKLHGKNKTYFKK